MHDPRLMKRSKIIKLLAKNLIRQNNRLLEERREERQLAIDRQLIAEDRAARLVSLLTQVGPELVAWLVGDPDRGDACPERSSVDSLADEVRDADLAVDLLAMLQTISKGQQDQMEAILSSEQKLALQRLARKSADRVSENAELDRAARDRRSSTDPIGVGDVVVLSSGGPHMVVVNVVSYTYKTDEATCSWRSEMGEENNQSFPLSSLVLVRRVAT